MNGLRFLLRFFDVACSWGEHYLCVFEAFKKKTYIGYRISFGDNINNFPLILIRYPTLIKVYSLCCPLSKIQQLLPSDLPNNIQREVPIVSFDPVLLIGNR
jgi:hypothetical protein